MVWVILDPLERRCGDKEFFANIEVIFLHEFEERKTELISSCPEN